MQGYVLTERGKLLVAMLIVLLLVLPSLIFVIWSVSKNNPDEEGNTPTGSYQNGSEAPGSDASASASKDSYGQDGDNPNSDIPQISSGSSINPVLFDLDEGKMSFLFNPDKHNNLDSDTTAAIGFLLTSPKNTEDTIFAVEIPQLTDEKTAIVTTAVLNAFELNNVSVNDVIFFVYQPEPDLEDCKINISLR